MFPQNLHQVTDPSLGFTLGKTTQSRIPVRVDPLHFRQSPTEVDNQVQMPAQDTWPAVGTLTSGGRRRVKVNRSRNHWSKRKCKGGKLVQEGGLSQCLVNHLHYYREQRPSLNRVPQYREQPLHWSQFELTVDEVKTQSKVKSTNRLKVVPISKEIYSLELGSQLWKIKPSCPYPFLMDYTWEVTPTSFRKTFTEKVISFTSPTSNTTDHGNSWPLCDTFLTDWSHTERTCRK